MPRAKISKKQQPEPEPELNEDLMNERLDALNMRYREKVLADFISENKGPELDQIIEHNKCVSAIEDEILKATETLQEAVNKYLETGKNMEQLFTLRKSVDSIEDKLFVLPPLPKECKNLFKEYKQVLSIKGF